MKRYKQCILATCPVPWDEDYQLEEAVFRRQIRHILQHGTRNIYIFGTAGEGYAVSDSQFDRITRVFYEEMKDGGGEPMIGVISLSLQTVIERIEASRRRGLRLFQLSLPAWGECTFSEIRRFFTETSGRFKDCSFLHYNSPRSKRLITPNEYQLLAEEFENLIATKNGAGLPFQILSLVRKAPTMQHFLTEFNFATACSLGLQAGLLISVASMHWESANRFYQAGTDRRLSELSRYTSQLEDILNNLFRIVGPQGHVDGAYDKFFAKAANPRFPLRLLPPYGWAQEESFTEFMHWTLEHYPQWADENIITAKE